MLKRNEPHGDPLQVPPVESAMWRFGSKSVDRSDLHLKHQDVAILQEMLEAYDECDKTHAAVQHLSEVTTFQI